MKLTAENYHSREANQVYMSVSQYKQFLYCEAAAMASLDGWDEGDRECMVVSSFVHASIEGTLERFKAEHPHVFSSRGNTKGELKASYKQAEKMVEVLQNDEMCRNMLQGEKEVIITAELFGVMWKAKIDVLSTEEGRIVDLKAVKSIRESIWSAEEGRKVSFVEFYKYPLQMAVYRKIEQLQSERHEPLEPFIVAVSKEDEPDKEVICFDDQTLNEKLEEIQVHLPRFVAVKEGIEEPERCESCKYCRQTKKASIIHYLDLLGV